jgi:hypothetical protein
MSGRTRSRSPESSRSSLAAVTTSESTDRSPKTMDPTNRSPSPASPARPSSATRRSPPRATAVRARSTRCGNATREIRIAGRSGKTSSCRAGSVAPQGTDAAPTSSRTIAPPPLDRPPAKGEYAGPIAQRRAARGGVASAWKVDKFAAPGGPCFEILAAQLMPSESGRSSQRTCSSRPKKKAPTVQRMRALGVDAAYWSGEAGGEGFGAGAVIAY